MKLRTPIRDRLLREFRTLADRIDRVKSAPGASHEAEYLARLEKRAAAAWAAYENAGGSLAEYYGVTRTTSRLVS